MEARANDDVPIAIESQSNIRKQGGWITLPFIIGANLCLSLAGSGATANIIVYLINEYNIKSVDAAQISNIINGCLTLAPILGAVMADAYFGCYAVVLFSSITLLLAMTMFILTTALSSLRPSTCLSGSVCQSSSIGQLVFLYVTVALLTIGVGGTRFTISTMGADQFDKPAQRGVYFNWYFVTYYSAQVIGSTVLVYVQNSISWTLGFGLALAANVVGVVSLISGSRYYIRPKVEGSPFTDMARVIVASLRKRMVVMSKSNLEYYYGVSEAAKPTINFRFFNRAAVITPADDTTRTTTTTTTINTSPWRLCTVQQVEDFKDVFRIIPLWSSSILVSISVGVILSLTVLQALTMDRHLGSHFTIPASTMLVFSLFAAAAFIVILDRLIYPIIRTITGHTLTPLQRIGIGQFINIIGFITAALVERMRESIVHSHNAEKQSTYIVPMSVMWLVIPLLVIGAAEALHFPGQVALYYQEFPLALRSTATALVATILSLGFYLSTVVIDLVRRLTNWLPENLNDSRLDNVFWLVSGLVAANFGYYLLCACLYKYNDKHTGDVQDENSK